MGVKKSAWQGYGRSRMSGVEALLEDGPGNDEQQADAAGLYNHRRDEGRHYNSVPLFVGTP